VIHPIESVDRFSSDMRRILTFIAETYSVHGTTFIAANRSLTCIFSAISLVLPATLIEKKEAAQPDP
jgi:hypothetical protein